jgi:hypothetical protein
MIGYPQRLVPRAEDKDKPPNYLVEHAVISVFELRVILDRLKKMAPAERNALMWNNKLKRLEPALSCATMPPVPEFGTPLSRTPASSVRYPSSKSLTPAAPPGSQREVQPPRRNASLRAASVRTRGWSACARTRGARPKKDDDDMPELVSESDVESDVIDVESSDEVHHEVMMRILRHAESVSTDIYACTLILISSSAIYVLCSLHSGAEGQEVQNQEEEEGVTIGVFQQLQQFTADFPEPRAETSGVYRFSRSHTCPMSSLVLICPYVIPFRLALTA